MLCCWLGFAVPAAAQTLAPQERLCDPTFEDCRADILTYIQQEKVQIDMGFWLMTDARYSNALVAAWQRGVKIRLLMDPRCGDAHTACNAQNDQLQAAGIPMRNRITSGILHWKVIIFAGQGQVEFAGANYAPFEMTPEIPYVNFTDEIVMFTKNPSLVQSFMRRFDDLWISTSEFGDYANITAPLTRSYPLYSIDPQLNFPPDESYRTRSLNAYAAEQQGIDVLMFRITDESQSNAMIAALGRGVPVRLITDETEYRNPTRLWDSYNVDKMFNAGVQVRLDAHQGIDHAKGIVLKGTGMTIFGSSNWTSASTDQQREHNLFTTTPWIFQWVNDLFVRKWTNATGNSETKPFVPLPPDPPAYNLPANNATGVATSGVVLSWNAGLWAHNYDIYFGTSPNPPLLEANKNLGPSQFSTDYRTYALPALQPGTTYYWKIVSKTMAFVPNEGPIWTFTTAGGTPPPTGLPAGWSDSDIGATGTQGGATFSGGTWSVSGGGADVWGTADAFNFAYRSLSGDGTIVARLSSTQFVNSWTKAGVMFRTSLSPSSAHAFMLVAASTAKGTNFQRRPTDGAVSVGNTGTLTSAPRWVKLVRTGNVISGYEGPDGVNWNLVGSDTISMPAGVLVGLAVTSHVAGTNATAVFDSVTVTAAAPPPNTPPTISITSPANAATFTAPATVSIVANASDSDGSVSKVEFFANGTSIGTDTASPYTFSWGNVAAGSYSVTAVATDNNGATASSAAVSITVNAAPPPPPSLPAGWSQTDIGLTGTTGSSSFSNGTFSVTGGGADVWGTADAFQFAYVPLSGDGTIIARVASVEFANTWTKAGVMIRGSLSPSSAHAFMLVAASSTKGTNFQRRPSDGAASLSTPGSLVSAPRWVKLVRTGNVITGYDSADGVTWTQVGSETVVMGPDVFIGLAVTSHVAGTNATATFTNVSIQ